MLGIFDLVAIEIPVVMGQGNPQRKGCDLVVHLGTAAGAADNMQRVPCTSVISGLCPLIVHAGPCRFAAADVDHVARRNTGMDSVLL